MISLDLHIGSWCCSFVAPAGVSTVPEGVQLLESFYHLAVRGSMKLTLEAKTIKLYQMFKEELKKVKATFERGGKKKDPPLPLGQV